MDKAALLVGIDEYGAQSLTGCVADAERVGKRLERHRTKAERANFACELLLGEAKKPAAVTRAKLRERLTHLLQRPVDHALFYFSGHATIRKASGMLVTQDSKRWEEGIPMAEVVEMANGSKINEVTLVIDSCYTGHLTDSQFDIEQRVRLRDGVSILGAANGDDQAQSGHRGSVFTSLVCEALDGAGADLRGRVTVATIYNHVDCMLGPLTQRPILRAAVERFSTLRECDPRVTDPDLRRIPDYFIKEDDILPLDPGYNTPVPVPPGWKADKRKHDDMAYFRMILAAGLLEPDGADYLWTAADQSKGCKLTMSGRVYWRMVKAKRI